MFVYLSICQITQVKGNVHTRQVEMDGQNHTVRWCDMAPVFHAFHRRGQRQRQLSLVVMGRVCLMLFKFWSFLSVNGLQYFWTSTSKSLEKQLQVFRFQRWDTFFLKDRKALCKATISVCTLWIQSASLLTLSFRRFRTLQQGVPRMHTGLVVMLSSRIILVYT